MQNILNFTTKFDVSCEALALFVDEKLNYEKRKALLPDFITVQIDAFLRIRKSKKKENTIFSFDISSQQKCFIIKVKNKYKKYYPEEIGGMFFSNVQKFKNITKIYLHPDSLNQNKEQLLKFTFQKFNFVTTKFVKLRRFLLPLKPFHLYL